MAVVGRGLRESGLAAIAEPALAFRHQHNKRITLDAIVADIPVTEDLYRASMARVRLVLSSHQLELNSRVGYREQSREGLSKQFKLNVWVGVRE